MAEKTKIGKNSTPANANLGCIPSQTITRQPNHWPWTPTPRAIFWLEFLSENRL